MARACVAREILIRYDGFIDSLEKRVATGSRDLYTVAAEQLRGVYRTIIEITPPAHNGVKGAKAEAHGKTVVASDIRKIYGTPGDAYDHIAETSRAKASAFWLLRKKRKPEKAAEILMSVTGRKLYPFDGGRLHQRMRNARGRVAGNASYRGKYGFFVDNAKDVEDYIKEVQSSVGYLAGGWRDIASKLGIPLLEFVARQNSPSLARVEITPFRLGIYAENSVPWASYAGVERRVQWAIDRQEEKMERSYQDFMNKKFWKDQGFKMAA
jgi:hypothetical protein